MRAANFPHCAKDHCIQCGLEDGDERPKQENKANIVPKKTKVDEQPDREKKVINKILSIGLAASNISWR